MTQPTGLMIPAAWMLAEEVELKDGEAILELILKTIAGVYRHPNLFGRTAGEVDVILWNYHRLWVVITERDFKEFQSLDCDRTILGHHCNLGISGHFRGHTEGGAEAGEDEAIEFVIQAWKRIDERLGLILPKA